MTSQAVMKRYLTAVSKTEEYANNKTIQNLATAIANFKKLDKEQQAEINVLIEGAYKKLQAKGFSVKKTPTKTTTTRKTRTTSQGGLKAILAELKKKLGSEKFKEATTGTDIQKDIKIPALKKGKRIVRKKGYTTNQYGTFKNQVGTAYWESRANRFDANQPSQTRKYKLADGGKFDDIYYGVVDSNNNLVFQSQNEREAKHISDNYENSIVKKYKGKGKIHKYAKGGDINSYDNPKNATHTLHIDGQNWYLEKIDSTHFYMSNNPKYRGMAHHIGQHKGEVYYDEIKQWLRDTKFAKGGEVGNINYNDILPILKEQIEDAMEILPNDFQYASEFKGEEVESKSRDGFIAFTDGGYEAIWFEYSSIFTGGGYTLPTKSLDDELQRQAEQNYAYAKERFVDEYPQIVEELGEDNIDYSSLYDAGYESEAEQLSEWEMDSDDTIMCKIGGYYYAPDNSRGVDGKHTIRLFGLVNLESPYHRSGNLEDRIDIDITFNSIEELKEKLDLEISEITNWFYGGKYDESRERLKIVRMAKGGKIEVGSIVNLPEIKMKDGRVQFERVVGGEVIGFEDGVYDVLNPKTNRIHRVSKNQIEKPSAYSKHRQTASRMRNDEDTYPKGTEFAKGGNVERGSAHIYVTKTNGEYKVYHGSDVTLRKNAKPLYSSENNPEGTWDKIWSTLRGSKMANGGNTSKLTEAEREQAERELREAWEGKNIDDYVMYSDKFAKGGNVQKSVTTTEYVSKEEIKRFEDYVYKVYEEYGFTKEQVKQAVKKYINHLEPITQNAFTWGGGDSLDRERVYEYLLDPKLKHIKNPTFAKGGTTKRIKRRGC